MDIVKSNYFYSTELSRSKILTKCFQNMDKVSCYVNAVLECLLHLSAIRKQLFNPMIKIEKLMKQCKILEILVKK